MDQIAFLVASLKLAFIVWVLSNLAADLLERLSTIRARRRATKQQHRITSQRPCEPATPLVAIVLPALRLGLSERELMALVSHELQERQAWTK